MGLYPSIADHTFRTLSEKRVKELYDRLAKEGREASISSTEILGTKHYTVCWND